MGREVIGGVRWEGLRRWGRADRVFLGSAIPIGRTCRRRRNRRRIDVLGRCLLALRRRLGVGGVGGGGRAVEWGKEGHGEDGRCLQPFDPMLTAEGPKAGRVMPVKNHGGYSVRMVTLEGRMIEPLLCIQFFSDFVTGFV